MSEPAGIFSVSNAEPIDRSIATIELPFFNRHPVPPVLSGNEPQFGSLVFDYGNVEMGILPEVSLLVDILSSNVQIFCQSTMQSFSQNPDQQIDLSSMIQARFDAESACRAPDDDEQPDPKCVQAAKAFIVRNPLIKALFAPYIAFTEDEAVLSWQKGEHKLMLFISARGISGFSKKPGEKISTEFSGEAEAHQFLKELLK